MCQKCEKYIENKSEEELKKLKPLNDVINEILPVGEYALNVYFFFNKKAFFHFSIDKPTPISSIAEAILIDSIEDKKDQFQLYMEFKQGGGLPDYWKNSLILDFKVII